MNRQELHDVLIAEGFNPDIFDVRGVEIDPHPGDVFLLRHVRSGVVGQPDKWVTYYSERGGQFQRRHFSSEDEACRYFLSWIGSIKAATL